MRFMALCVFLFACGKKAPEAPAPETAPPPPPPPAAAPEPEPEPEGGISGSRPAEPNANFSVLITMANAEQIKDTVVRVERSEDWYGEKGWTDDPAKLTVTVEVGATEIEVPWDNISRIEIAYKEKDAIDCQYDSSYTPMMYMCVLPTVTKVKTKDAKTGEAASRHKWKFTFASGKVEEFWIFKLPAREQEEEVPSLGTVTENTALYLKLQEELMTTKAGRVPTSIAIF
jgi:hypothetical protein